MAAEIPTVRVLMSPELVLELEQHGWSFGDPDADGFYEPTISPPPVNVDRLAHAVETVGLSYFWRDEPAEIHDPPGMRRVCFLHREYAAALAREYESRP